jgi:hypothetical protein
MKSVSSVIVFTIGVVLCTVAIAAPVRAQTAQRWRLTFDAPVRVADATLPAGTYTFERIANFTTPYIVVTDVHGKLFTTAITRHVDLATRTNRLIEFHPSDASGIRAVAMLYQHLDGYEFEDRGVSGRLADRRSEIHERLLLATDAVTAAKTRLMHSEAARNDIRRELSGSVGERRVEIQGRLARATDAASEAKRLWGDAKTMRHTLADELARAR